MTGPYAYVPLGRFLEELSDGPFGSSLTSSHYSDDGARVIRLGNIGEARFKSDDEAYIPMEYFAKLRRHSVEPGDLLIAGLGDLGHPVGRACLAPEGLGPAIVKADCFRARLDQRRLLHRFAEWALNSKFVGQQVLTLTRGSTRARINLAVTKAIEIPVPPLEEQGRIADYLDRETAHIDTLIEEQQRLIEMLRERRHAVVEAAVATVRTSGTRLKHMIRSVRQGWSPQCFSWPADGVETWAVLKAGAANGGRFRPSENKELPADEIPRPEITVIRGDLLVSRANTRELVGSAAVVDGDFPRLMLCDKLYAFTLDENRADPRFVASVLGSRRWRDLIELEATGASHSMLNISQSDIVNLPMLLPPVAEQRRLLRYLNSETTKIDQLVAESERFMELARERRSALITAAVTGQIDVREMV